MLTKFEWEAGRVRLGELGYFEVVAFVDALLAYRERTKDMHAGSHEELDAMRADEIARELGLE